MHLSITPKRVIPDTASSIDDDRSSVAGRMSHAHHHRQSTNQRLTLNKTMRAYG
jgi:hypothetical protein